MKFLFITDTHGRTNNPASRKDDFPATILKKLKWCIAEANSDDAYILHGGDWVNRPDTAATFVAKMSNILEDAKKPIYGVLGNHDIYGYNPLSFQRTPLSIVNACKCINIIPDNEAVLIEENGINVYVSGASSTFLLDHDGRTDEYFTPRRDIPTAANEVRVHIVHGFLTNKDWPDTVAYTKINDILDTDADIILTGHEHMGYGIIYKNDRIFCNPGALGRVSASVGDINRDVNVAKISIDKNSSGLPEIKIDLKKLPPNIALPADEVLDREKIEVEKRTAQQMESFTEQINQIQLDEPTIAPGQAVEQLKSILDNGAFEDVAVTDTMKSLILDYVGRAQELENELKKKGRSENE